MAAVIYSICEPISPFLVLLKTCIALLNSLLYSDMPLEYGWMLMTGLQATRQRDSATILLPIPFLSGKCSLSIGMCHLFHSVRRNCQE